MKPPELEGQGAPPDFGSKPLRVARFFRSFFPVLFEWSSSDNPLSTMCAAGYQFPKRMAVISDCTLSGGVYVSAEVTLGPGFPDTNSGLYQAGCLGSVYQGFQVNGTTRFELTFDPSSNSTSIDASITGDLYALTDSWNYREDSLGKFEFGNVLSFVRNASDIYTHECNANTSISIENTGVACQDADEVFSSTSCTPVTY